MRELATGVVKAIDVERFRQNISREKFAPQVGVSSRMFKRYLIGEAVISVELLLRAADVLKRPATSFVDEALQRNKQ